MQPTQPSDSDRAVAEVAAAVRSVPADVLDAAAAMLAGAGRVAAYAGGREGLVLRGLVMRLFHAGLDAHYVGEMTVPRLGRGDLVVLSCGPGNIATVQAIAGVAKAAEAEILLFTAQPGRPPADVADRVVAIEAQTMATDTGSPAVLPMGSGYEIALLVLVDLLTNRVRVARQESAEAMRARHTNLE
jgi:6-phospho-3-hexuloisomerase